MPALARNGRAPIEAPRLPGSLSAEQLRAYSRGSSISAYHASSLRIEIRDHDLVPTLRRDVESLLSLGDRLTFVQRVDYAQVLVLLTDQHYSAAVPSAVIWRFGARGSIGSTLNLPSSRKTSDQQSEELRPRPWSGFLFNKFGASSASRPALSSSVARQPASLRTCHTSLDLTALVVGRIGLQCCNRVVDVSSVWTEVDGPPVFPGEGLAVATSGLRQPNTLKRI
jgi:hypothetical protein